MKTIERNVTVEVWVGHSDLLPPTEMFMSVLRVIPYTTAVRYSIYNCSTLSTHNTSIQCPMDLFELHNFHKAAKDTAISGQALRVPGC